MTKKFLDAVYGDDARSDITSFYTDWAASYDDELAENRYETPGRIAQMLLRAAVPKGISILDYGCGTGLSGAALKEVGFTRLHGTDPTPNMLSSAKAKGIYDKIWETDLSDPLPFSSGAYDMIAAIGVVSPGAAPASLLADIADKLGPGGYLTFSLNSHGLDDPDYLKAVDDLIARPEITLLADEHGPHLVARGMTSMIYLVQVQ